MGKKHCCQAWLPEMVEDELPQAVLWPHCANCGIYTHTRAHARTHAHTHERVHTHTHTKYVRAGELQKTPRTVLFISSLPLHSKSGKYRLFPLERNSAESSWEASSLVFTAPWMRDEVRVPYRVTWPYLSLLGHTIKKAGRTGHCSVSNPDGSVEEEGWSEVILLSKILLLC